MSIFSVFDAVVGVAHSAIEGLATLLTPSVGGLAAAVAIVGFTILVRLLVSPLSWLQARAAKRGAALAPAIAELRAKHKDDPMAAATETLALQRAHKAGPGMSLLPALVQAPFFMVMYRLVQPGTGRPQGLLSGNLFGVPLTAHLTAGLPIFAVLLALATALAVWSSRRARRSMAPANPVIPAAPSPAAPSPAAVRSQASKKLAAGQAQGSKQLASGQPRRPKTLAAAKGRETGQLAPSQTRGAKGLTPARPAPRRPKASTGAVPAAGKAGAGGQSSVEAAAPLVGRLMTVMPYLTIAMVAYLPLAGALYLVTSTAWTALEQAVWRRPAPSGNR